MDSKNVPRLGTTVSLISTAGVRYVGELYAVNPEGNTVTLNNVKSFGTEGRAAPFPMVPERYLFTNMLFHASDIVDISFVGESHASLPSDPAILGVQTESGQPWVPIGSKVDMNAARFPAMSPTSNGVMAGVSSVRAPPDLIRDSFLVGYQQQRLPPLQQYELREQQRAQVSVVDFEISGNHAMPVSRTRLTALPTPPGFENDFFRVNSMQPRKDETSQQNANLQKQSHNPQMDEAVIPNWDKVDFGIGDFRPLPSSPPPAFERNDLFAVREERRTQWAAEEQQQQKLQSRDIFAIKMAEQQQKQHPYEDPFAFDTWPKAIQKQVKPEQTGNHGAVGYIENWPEASVGVHQHNQSKADNVQVSSLGYVGKNNEVDTADSDFKIGHWCPQGNKNPRSHGFNWYKFHANKPRNDEIHRQISDANVSVRSNQSMASRGRKPTQNSLIFEPTGFPVDFKIPSNELMEFRNDFNFIKNNQKFEKIRSRLSKHETKDEDWNRPIRVADQSAKAVAVGYKKSESFFDNISCISNPENTFRSKNYTLHASKLNHEAFGQTNRRRVNNNNPQNESESFQRKRDLGDKTDKKPEDSCSNANNSAKKTTEASSTWSASGKGAVPKQTQQHRR